MYKKAEIKFLVVSRNSSISEESLGLYALQNAFADKANFTFAKRVIGTNYPSVPDEEIRTISDSGLQLDMLILAIIPKWKMQKGHLAVKSSVLKPDMHAREAYSLQAKASHPGIYLAAWYPQDMPKSRVDQNVIDSFIPSDIAVNQPLLSAIGQYLDNTPEGKKVDWEKIRAIVKGGKNASQYNLKLHFDYGQPNSPLKKVI